MLGGGRLGWPELILIAAVVLLLFGARKLPDLAKGIGQSLRVFRAEMRKDDDGAATGQAGVADPAAGSVATPGTGTTGSGATGPGPTPTGGTTSGSNGAKPGVVENPPEAEKS